MKIKFKRLNHLQLCIPKHQEDTARKFYCEILNLEEIEKPVDLKKNGGFWLSIADIELHIGVEDHINTSKRHPAFEIEHLDRIEEALRAKGVRIKKDKSLPRYHRFSLYDPFNNRIELLEAKSKEEITFLGKTVQVKIDRALHTKHPDYNFTYELNYGYIPDTKAEDGEEIDAYVLGVEKPIETFEGIVKAVINRYNDVENKLIVTPPEYEITKAEIIRLTNFQEHHFDIAVKLIET